MCGERPGRRKALSCSGCASVAVCPLRDTATLGTGVLVVGECAQLFSAESGTACAAAWKPIFEWVPSQNGFFVDAPQRQSTVLS